MEEPLKIRIRDVNPHIVCSLCAGYFVDATTVTECLHTFCKSCIVKYLQSHKHCPQCNTKIHETQPLLSLKPDRVMQDIIFKLVPGLFEDEEKRKVEFYKAKGLIKEQKEEDEKLAPPLTSVYDDPQSHYYMHDELVCFCLDNITPIPGKGNTPVCVPLPKKFVRCSVRTCVQHIQILLRKKLQIPPEFKVEVMCREETLASAVTLKQVLLQYWFGRRSPMMLQYFIRPKIVSPYNQQVETS